MGTLTNVWRSHLLSTLSGDDDGRPYWVETLETGDDAGYFGPGSASWAVHGGISTMVAGIRALLMQTLHPGAMAGVHDWSRYQEDPLGRLSGTIQWLLTVTYGDRALAQQASTRVGRFHDRVVGTYVDARGDERPYAAGDAELLSWVHVVFNDAFLRSHETWGGGIPGGADRYVDEWATAGELIGVADAPHSEGELRAQLEAFRAAGTLMGGERVDEAVRFIRSPREYRRMLGLKRSPLPVVTATRLVLGLVRIVLGPSSTSERAARKRIASLRSTSV
jgi:uncharacterized protein (DUF2236 family)